MNNRRKHSLSTASPSLGIPFIRQSNDPASPAVYCSRTDVSVNEKNQRISAFDAFLPPELVKTRKNLTICTRTVVLSLELQDEAVGPRAVGVYIQDEAASVKAKKILVSAKREIVLSAGAIGTPQILLLSGIGDPKHLNSVGIEIVHELPGVGLGLQDHLAVALIYKAPRAHTFYELMHNRVHALRELLKYVFTRKGMFLSSYTQVAIFARSALLDDSMHTVGSPEDLNAHSPANVPDLEIQPIAFGIPNDSEQHQIVLRKEDGAVSLLVQLLRPKSSGSVKLKSKNPRDRPKCDLGALKDANDYVVLRKGIKLALALGQRMKEDGYPSEPLDLPRDESDAALDEFVKGRAISTFHYSSTCRMAPRDLGGVVDDQLRVHGVVGLRIADASIFPTIPACHLQAPVVMVGERCADFIKKTNTVAS
jgi:choline dehydrogenase